MSFARSNRKIHKWASIVVALPLLIVIISGILLLLKKEFSYIQPATQRGIGSIPSVSFTTILAQAKSVPQAKIDSWHDINRLDVRPTKGVIKVRANNQWEIQLDSQSGDVLQVAYRRSNFIESLHDGTFFHDKANLWLMLPTSLILLALSITGLYLFLLPYLRRR